MHFSLNRMHKGGRNNECKTIETGIAKANYRHEDATYELSIRMILDAQNELGCDIYQLNYEMSKGEITYSTHTVKWHTDDGARCTRHYNVYNA